VNTLVFFVNQGENDCFMAHGLDWAVYTEAANWEQLRENIVASVARDFRERERPERIELKFADGRQVLLGA
jgi:hypothetical protein